MKQNSPGVSFSIFVAVVSLLHFCSGCATPPTTLPPEARARINQTRAISYIPQEEVNVQFMPSSYGAGLGLLGAVVDAGVNASLAGSAESRAKRIRENVRDYDFRHRYWAATSNVVATTDWMKLGHFSMVASNVAPVKPAAVTEAALMNIGTDYFISPNGRVFEVSTGIGVYLPQKNKKPSAANTMIYYSAEIGDVEGDKAAEKWIENGGAALRQAADEGIQESAKLMRHALDLMGGTTNVTMKAARVRAKLVHGRAGFGIPVGRTGLLGNVIEENPDRIIFQAKQGPLYSWPRREVEVVYLNSK